MEEKSNFDEETRRKEKERELQRLKQSFDPRKFYCVIFIAPFFLT